MIMMNRRNLRCARVKRLMAVLFLTVPCLVSTPAAALDHVELRMISVSSRQQAEEIQERLAKGESFAALATAMSVGPNASRGGYIGKVEFSSLRPELKEVVVPLEENEVSDIVRTGYGYTILQVVNREVLRSELKDLYLRRHKSSTDHCRLAWEYMLRGMMVCAEWELRSAVRTGPLNGRAHYLLAHLYALQGKYTPALEHLRRAKSLGYPVGNNISVLSKAKVEKRWGKNLMLNLAASAAVALAFLRFAHAGRAGDDHTDSWATSGVGRHRSMNSEHESR
jgi:hypothetical protein